MPIPVKCQCGQAFQAGDHLAGKRVKCPKCTNPLTIPNPAAEEADDYSLAAPEPVAKKTISIFDDAGLTGPAAGQTRCPNCEAIIAETAVLCVKCGFNRQTGKVVESKVKQKKADSGGHGGIDADEVLDQAAERMEADRRLQEAESAEGMSVATLAGSLLFAVSFLGMMLWLPGSLALHYGGITIAIVGLLMWMFYAFVIVAHAFNKNVVEGVLFLFVPFYGLYYIITNWEAVGGKFIMSLLAVVVLACGVGLMLLAPLFEEKEFDEGDKASLYAPIPIVRPFDYDLG